MAILNRADATSPWVFSKTISAAGVTTNNLATAGTLLDRNIGIRIETPEGQHSASINSHTVTQPSVDASIAGSITTKTGYGITSTKPSGTDGTAYLTISPSGNKTNGVSTASAKSSITTEGYLEVGNKISGNSIINIIPEVNTGSEYYIPIVGPTFSGGTVTATVSATPSNAKATITSSGSFVNASAYGVTTIQPSGTDGTNYLTIDGILSTTSGSVLSKANATSTAVTYSNNPGLISSHSNSTAVSGKTAAEKSTSTTVNVTEDDKFVPLYIPMGTITFQGGGLSATSNYTGTPTVSLSLTSQTTTGAAYTTTKPSTGFYLTLQGSTAKLTGTTTVTKDSVLYNATKGVIKDVSGGTAQNSTSKTASVTVNAASSTGYITIPSASFSRVGNTVSWTEGYIAANSSTGSTTSVTQGTSTLSSGTVNRANASWGTGWITGGNIPAAKFANTATSGTTYLDISDTTEAPVLISGDYLYINKGYTDNLKISLAQLVPNGASANLAAGYILNGYSAYNNDGILVAGNIPSLSATTYYPKTTDQTISSGQYISGTQTIKAVTTSNLSAANIKHGVTVKVGDAADDDRIAAVTGSFYNDGTTYTLNSIGTIDMGSTSSHRYIKTDGLQVIPTATYTATQAVTNADITTYGKLTIGSAAGNISITKGSVEMTGNNCTLSATDTSGISLSRSGLSITAATNITTAGWVAKKNSWISSSSSIAAETEYLTGVKLVPPTSGTRSFSIEVPNGSTTEFITFVFTVDASGNVTVDGQ